MSKPELFSSSVLDDKYSKELKKSLDFLNSKLQKRTAADGDNHLKQHFGSAPAAERPDTADPTWKLCSCSLTFLSCFWQELKMRSSVSRSQAFSSLIRASSCSSSEVVSGDRTEGGSSAGTPPPPNSRGFTFKGSFCSKERGPECSESTFCQQQKKTEQRGIEGTPAVNNPLCKVTHQSIPTRH